MAMAKKQPKSNQMLQVCHQASKTLDHQSCNLEAASKAQDRQTSNHQSVTPQPATTLRAATLQPAI